MKKILKLLPVVFFACSTILVSCGSDDKDEPGSTKVPPSINNVFSNGLPTTVVDNWGEDINKFTVNNKGQLTKIDCEASVIDFEYGPFESADDYDVKMTITRKRLFEPYDTYVYSVFYLRLNNQGFISHAREDVGNILGDGVSRGSKYDITYDSEGHLVSYVKNHNYNKDYDVRISENITYTNGDITKVESKIEDNDGTSIFNWYFFYTDDDVKTPYPNKGNVMLFENCYHSFVFDEFKFAYYAGLLGKSTKNLPILLSLTEEKLSYKSEIFAWKFNENGFPTRFETENQDYSASFTWN